MGRQFPARCLPLRKWSTRTLELSSNFSCRSKCWFPYLHTGIWQPSPAHFLQSPLFAKPMLFITGAAHREQGPLSYSVMLPGTGPGSQWVLSVAPV